jgi:hypothetical protein
MVEPMSSLPSNRFERLGRWCARHRWPVVAAWLAGIIGNLLLVGDYYDVALRDFGLLVGALALARLAGSSGQPGGSTGRAAR